MKKNKYIGLFILLNIALFSNIISMEPDKHSEYFAEYKEKDSEDLDKEKEMSDESDKDRARALVRAVLGSQSPVRLDILEYVIQEEVNKMIYPKDLDKIAPRILDIANTVFYSLASDFLPSGEEIRDFIRRVDNMIAKREAIAYNNLRLRELLDGGDVFDVFREMNKLIAEGADINLNGHKEENCKEKTTKLPKLFYDIYEKYKDLQQVDKKRLDVFRYIAYDNTFSASGYTPLTLAIRLPIHLTVNEIRFLLDNGADLNSSNELGMTPLGLAIKLNRLDVARVLINRGACLDIIDKYYDKTPFMLAFERLNALMDDDDIKEILLMIKLMLKKNPYPCVNFEKLVDIIKDQERYFEDDKESLKIIDDIYEQLLSAKEKLELSDKFTCIVS